MKLLKAALAVLTIATAGTLFAQEHPKGKDEHPKGGATTTTANEHPEHPDAAGLIHRRRTEPAEGRVRSIGALLIDDRIPLRVRTKLVPTHAR